MSFERYCQEKYLEAQPEVYDGAFLVKIVNDF